MDELSSSRISLVDRKLPKVLRSAESILYTISRMKSAIRDFWKYSMGRNGKDVECGEMWRILLRRRNTETGS
jgi:hypothetical protein